MDNLNILPIVDEVIEKNGHLKDVHPNLPSIKKNFCILILGRVRSGKSTLISNLLLNDNFYKDMSERVVIFSQTILIDSTSRFLKEKYEEEIYTEYDDSIIENIIETQRNTPENERILTTILCDDMLGSIPKNSKIFYLTSRYRHFNINLIFTAQLFRSVPPVCRSNSNFIIICWNLIDVEVEKVAEEYGSLTNGDDKFMSIYKKNIQKDPYAFLSLNMESGQVLKNFKQEFKIEL